MCAFRLLSPTCSSFKEYVDCSERVTRRTCGIETGLFIRDFLHRMADSLMQNFCEEHYKGTNQCPIEFSMATKRLSSAFLLILNVVCSLATLTVLQISWWEIVQRTWKSWWRSLTDYFRKSNVYFQCADEVKSIGSSRGMRFHYNSILDLSLELETE